MHDTLVAIGEALIDFIPHTTGCTFHQVEAFFPAVGGAPANVCGAFATLGGRAKMITQLGDDPFGHKILTELSGYGVDTSCICLTNQANTALAFVSLSDDGNRTFSFYRNPSADMLFSQEQLRDDWFRHIYALHFCSVSLGDFPMGKAHIPAIHAARAHGGLISFDPNLRFPLWKDAQSLHDAVQNHLPLADILKISDEELEFITGTADIRAALPQLFTGHVKLVIYTCGSHGAYAFTRNAEAFSPALPVEATDTTGAGDGFIGAFLYKLKELGVYAHTLEQVTVHMLQQCLDFSNLFCAISVQAKGALPSYPTMDALLK